MIHINKIRLNKFNLIIKLKGVNKMSFKNPDRLKKKKNISKKVPKDLKDSNKFIPAKKPKE